MEREKELARRFAASYISINMGISLDSAYKTYCQEEVGVFWFLLAMETFKQFDLQSRKFSLEGR